MRTVGCDPKHVAGFTDQRGAKREAFVILPNDADNRSWISKFAYYGQPVGLLYLPDTKAVIVTDLWLNSYPEPDPATRKPVLDYEKAKAQSMTREEKEKLERDLRFLMYMPYIMFAVIVVMFVISLWR